MGGGAAGGGYSERAEVDEAAGVIRVCAAAVPTLRAAEAGQSAAMPEVMRSAKRGGRQTSDVTAALIGLSVGSHRAGCYAGGQREHGARNNKPSHHGLLRVLFGLGGLSHSIEISVAAPRAMTIVSTRVVAAVFPIQLPVIEFDLHRRTFLRRL